MTTDERPGFHDAVEALHDVQCGEPGCRARFAQERAVEIVYPIIVATACKKAAEREAVVRAAFDGSDLFAGDAPYVEAAWKLRADVLAALGDVS